MENLQERMREAVQSFKDKECYFVIDETNLNFFSKYSENKEKLIVTEKISAINEHLINPATVPVMADHIIALNIDAALENNDISIVEKIAAIKITKGEKLKYFASMYCNYHKPDVYPIYSERNKGILLLYCSMLSNEDFSGEDLSDYKIFKKVTDAFCKDMSLTKLDYHELNKFMWIREEMIVNGLKSA